MYREKNKSSFFAIHQIVTKIRKYKPNVQIDFHILWDKKVEGISDNINWDNKLNIFLDISDVKMYSYDREFFDNYCREFYSISEKTIDQFNKFSSIYFLLIAHYLRRVKLEKYYLIYDDDILINYDFCDIIDYMMDNTPILLVEVMNSNCDKVLFNKLNSIYDNTSIPLYLSRNPNQFGFNAGFQGIDLSIYDDFLSVDRFNMMLELFDYSGIYDSNGNEIWGPQRFSLDTQQQSFFGIMNIIKSKKDPVILDPTKYFIVPNWGEHPTFGNINSSDENEGWTIALKSKITHFIGHTQGKGKPKTFLNKVDEYLQRENLL